MMKSRFDLTGSGIRKLAPYAFSGLGEKVQATCADASAPVTPAILVGSWKGVRFVATEDHDGQIEVSLSGGDARRYRKFFAFLGMEPVSEPLLIRGAVHWLVRAGGPIQ